MLELWLLSGMLPGHVAGLYSYDDCHIDLGLLSNFARYSAVKILEGGREYQ